MLLQAWAASSLIILSDLHYTWNVYGITISMDVGTYLGYLDGSFYGSNDGKI